MRIQIATRSRRSRLPLVATAAATAAATVVLGLAAPAQAAADVSYPSSVPAWATASADAGPAAAGDTIEGEIYFNLKDPAAAKALATAVSTPGSPRYRQFVTPQQWIDRFSPAEATYQNQLAELVSGGFQITGTPKSRLFIVFRGTAAQVQAAFGTTMHRYAVAGRQLLAPSQPPKLRGDLAAAVTGMEIDQGRQLTHPNSATPADPAGARASAAPAATSPAQLNIPCSNYYGQYSYRLPAAYGQTVFPTGLCGYTPQQLRTAYGVPSSGLTGAGQKVAIIDAFASPTIQLDVNTYSARRGEPQLTDGQYSQIVPTTFYDQQLCAYPSGWQGEQTLDVEAVHGIAPAANILYVGGFNCGGGIDVALSQILDGKLATIVSNSYGDVGEAVPADAIMGQENQHLQAAAEGIGLYYSSGDFGDEAAALGTPQPDYEASSPWVTSVGGTSTGIDRNGAVVAETGWGSHRVEVDTNGRNLVYAGSPPGTFRFGAGGGRSTIFPQPAYQRGVVSPSLAKGMRVSPDIAADADPYTGMLIGLSPIVDDTTLATGSYVEESIGGTSLATPLVAAQMALVQQMIGVTIGFANPAIYALHKTVPSIPRDVSDTKPFPLAFTSPTTGLSYLVTGNLDTSLAVRSGYDDVTGLGAITFDMLRRAATGR